MSRINDLLRQLDATNPALARDLREEVDALSDRRAFGLNFERHQPEAVELPGRKVRRGDKVHVLPERGTNPTQENEKLWRVVSIDRSGEQPVATLEPLDPPVVEPVETPAETSVVEEAGHGRLETTHPLEDLVVVAEFRDPIYPGLVSTGKVERGGDKPFHTVINAENYHALQTLLFTHRGQVDCIYIDPPYNTGNEGWIYNDQYVADDDLYKHSKWLAFMERRLLLARELLKPTGVIIVAIGDDEHHRLRMLMDQVFDPRNFISDLVWQGGIKNSARFTGGGLDYMLVFARDIEATGNTQWREQKGGADQVISSARRAFTQADGDVAKATAIHREWLRANKGALEGVLPLFNTIVGDGRAARVNGDLAAPDDPHGNRPRYELLHPETGRPVRIPTTGWRWTEDKMRAAIADGRIFFPADDAVTPQGIAFLDERTEAIPRPSFIRERFLGSRHVQKVLGDGRFPNPKDHEVLMRWLRMATSRDACVVDFFGGSGSTAEAVMRLNQEDGGSRRCILVTNNEAAAADAKKLRKAGHRPGDPGWEAKGVYEYVAKPRIETVVSGIRPDGSTYSDGLEQNVEFFTLTYEAPLRVSSNREFAKIAPLLWMRAGSRGRRIDSLDAGWDVADTYGVIADLDQSEKFLKAVAEAGGSLTMAFIVTDEDRLFQTVCRELPDHVEPVRLYEAYLRNFEIETARGGL